jgi:hypothetical protein
VLGALHLLAEGQTVQRLPVEEPGLYRRTMQNLTSVCARDDSRSLRDFCRDQAQLALMLPECDRACESLARERLRAPTR